MKPIFIKLTGDDAVMNVNINLISYVKPIDSTTYNTKVVRTWVYMAGHYFQVCETVEEILALIATASETTPKEEQKQPADVEGFFSYTTTTWKPVGYDYWAKYEVENE